MLTGINIGIVSKCDSQGRLFGGKSGLQRVSTGFWFDVLHFVTRYILQRSRMKRGGIFPIVNHRREVLKYL